MKMMDILCMFLTSERMGIWELHIQTLYEMLPFMAASGHKLYAKPLHIYLQNMTRLCDTHPYIFKHFSLGLHVVRRSDSLWAGLSSDLVSEQVRMRRMKTSGGTCEMLEFLQSRNPFSDNCNLRSIATDINAERRVNVGTAKTVGINLLKRW